MAKADAQQVTVLEDTSWERLWSGQAALVLSLARPWLVLGLVALAGWGGHQAWGRMPAVPWAVAGLTLAGVMLGVFTWHSSRLLAQGRAHSTATAGTVVAWLTVAVITGPGSRVTAGLLVIAGGLLALTWNIRMHVRRQAAGGQVDPAARLTAWFRDAAAPAGLPGARMNVAVIEPTRAAGTLQLPPGEKTAADAVSAARRVESGMKIPPGSLVMAENEDRADMANWSLSDPRLIRRGVPWPGASRPGASIALPLRPGVWQDGVPVAHVLPGHHVYMMGASGAGKSIGGGWNYAAEIITRPDAAMAVADITKGRQTFGPLAVALHRFETAKDGARDLIEGVYSTLKDRTDFLADHGLQKWQQDCGLSFLVGWLEETPDIYDALTGKGQDHFLTTCKALRSAGGAWVMSLQRNTFDQLPTIVRAQMASMCFGLNDPQDVRYGLSQRQREAGADPSEWGINYPGMAVLDAPGIPAARVAMPLRTFAWGEDSAAIEAYAASYPAAARPVDPITARVTGPSPASISAAPAGGPARPVAVLTRGPADAVAGREDDDLADVADDEDGAEVCGEYLTEDPNPDLPWVDPDDPIEPGADDEPFEFEAAEKMTPEAARAALAEQLAAWQADGRESFAPRDLRPVMDATGMGRPWIQARLREALDDQDGLVWREDSDTAGVYRLRRATVAV